MNLNISGLDKAKLLVALYNNAKDSRWTEASIGNSMCPDSFVRELIGHFYQPRIDAEIKKLELSEEIAQKLLASCSRVEYIGPVKIMIDFSTDTIDPAIYDRDNYGNGGARPAEDVVSGLRRGSPSKHPSFGATTALSSVGYFSASGGSDSEELESSITDKIRTLIHPGCEFFHMDIIGTSITLPRGTAQSDLERYAALLLSAGIDVTIQPESSFLDPELNIKGETLEALHSKMLSIEPISNLPTMRL